MNPSTTLQRNPSTIGLLNLGALLLTGAVAFVMGHTVGSAAAALSGLYCGLGVLVALVSFLHMRHVRAERLELMEVEQLRGRETAGRLFGEEAEVLRAGRAREQFERYFVPGWTVLILVVEAGLALAFLTGAARPRPPESAQALITAAFFGVFALIQFLFGKYSAGIARYENQPLLAPGGSHLMLAAVTSVLVAVASAANWMGLPRLDAILATVMAAALALLAVENAINLLMEIYRPRVKGGRARLLYESRLVALFGQPGGIFSTAAHALDYQFGFKVSETWFYRYLERALAWLLLIWGGIFLASTCVVVLEPHEDGLLERFGKPVAGREVLGPGLHFKLPWPVEQLHRHSTRSVGSFVVGFEEHEEEPEPVVKPKEEEEEHDHKHEHGKKKDEPRHKHGEAEVELWTGSHGHEETLMLVASHDHARTGAGEMDRGVPVNLISVHIPVQYDVTNVVAWARNHADAPGLLKRLAEREIVNYLVSVDIADIMSVGRTRAAGELRDLIQAAATANRLGARITFVGLWGIQPPAEVAPDYEAVIGAQQERASKILEAQGQKAELVPRARAEARKLIHEAEAYKVSKVSAALAQSGQFTNQMAAFAASPQVYRQRTYLNTLVSSIAKARKYILGTSSDQDKYELNLEDKFNPDLMDVKIPDPKRKK